VVFTTSVSAVKYSDRIKQVQRAQMDVRPKKEETLLLNVPFSRFAATNSTFVGFFNVDGALSLLRLMLFFSNDSLLWFSPKVLTCSLSFVNFKRDGLYLPLKLFALVCRFRRGWVIY